MHGKFNLLDSASCASLLVYDASDASQKNGDS